MKRFFEPIAKGIFLTTIIILFSIMSFSATYYVSSSGNNSNNGTTTSTPWQTLSKVNSTALIAGDVVLFKKGDSFYGSIIVPSSGSSANPITFGSYGTGANPIITGFTTVTAWTSLGSNIWESTNAVSTLSTCNMVAINGANTPMGTYPNSDAAKSGYLTYQSSTPTSITTSSLNGTPNWTGAEVVVKTSNFSIERRMITSQSGGTIAWATATGRGPSNNFGFFIQNDTRTLDKQNEWYFNPITKKIRVFSSGTPTNVRVASVDKLINVTKNFITIDGIDFTGANSTAVWNDPTDSPIKTKIIVKNCNISFVGISGVELRCSYQNIENNTITNSNSIGIRGAYASYVTIKNNKVLNTGINKGMGVGHAAVSVTYSPNSLIEFNSIINTGFNGITFQSESVTVKNNFIDTFCQILDDGGGIYTYTGANLPALNKILLQGNIIINGIGAPDGTNLVFPAIAAGIYLDNKSKNVEVSGNSISNCRKYGLYFNDASYINAHDNTIFGTWETVANSYSSQFKINHTWSPITFQSNLTINNNVFFSKAVNQYCLDLSSPVNNILNFGSANNNMYARPIDDSKSIRADQPTEWSGSKEYKTLAEWQSFSGDDANSKKSPQVITSESELQFEYNATQTAKTVTLSQPMIDAKGIKYPSSITLQPYTSVVLLKNATVNNVATVSGVPTSVIATAGNATASVTFAAPASDGGSAITGYTVTSIPLGGIDSNAGTTSNTHTITGLTNGTSYTFTVKATNTAGTSLASTASNSVIPTAPVVKATGITLIGPASGNVNSPSANFTVSPNNPYTGTITLTPTGTGSAGLSAKVLTFSNSATAQTFTITPTVAGSITLVPTNNGSLTNPANLTYTSNAVVPGVPTSVIATAGIASASVTFAAPSNNGGSAITGYTVSSIPAGGTDLNAGSTSLSHSITGLTSGTSYTFTVKATNSAGTSIASSASNLIIPTTPVATTFTFTGPTSGNVDNASANFTVTPNNPYTGTITLTPTGAGSAGLSAKVLTFSNSSAAQTFSITPSVPGSITFTPTNSSVLTNPTNLIYTAIASVSGAPKSVVATAGNASASVTFSASLNLSGAIITGYTVISIPAGGIDNNAGTTSLTHSVSGLTNGISYTFKVITINSFGSSAPSVASNSVIPSAPVASAFTFTGPISGNVNSASTNFTVTPNSQYTGTITLTPSGTGSTGLTANVLTFSNSSAPQTFTITPRVAGSITLTPTNSGILTNSANLVYTANAVVPDSPISVIATAGDANATVTFVAPTNNGGSAITGYTVTSIPAGGTDINAGSTSNTHTISGLTNGTSYTFTVRATNSAGTSLASSASNLVIPKAPVATAFTFTGPISGNVNSASANFTVTPNNLYTGTITLTPTGSGSTGLTASVLTFSNSSAAQTFTITPLVAGSITLTPTNNGTLSNSANLVYTANAVVPDSPISVVADAGDATATVTFVAPSDNGGSAITGYTVTSIPVGGTDINAGSTSNTHTITGLTNGTSYTFTVKATNAAGTSIASSASNLVMPIEPKDITLPLVSNFVMPPTSNSLTVSISAFTATDNIGVTGYLLTETSSTPSADALGWSASAPLTYSFLSAGTKALFAWSKDAAGNVSASQSKVVTISNNQTVELNSHFKTAWFGENGQNHMNIIVVSAISEGLTLTTDDEIALFSGSTCVGAHKLKRSINSADNSTFITILTSQNDGTNNGFTDNDTIIFKIWDNKNQQEMLVNAAIYLKDIPSWTTSGNYVPGATSAVEIEAFTENFQTIELKKGYNLISTYLTARDPNVASVTKSLYAQGNLIKVQDEAGNSFENWGSFGGWINKLGSVEKTEGYKIQVANNCTFQVIGKPIALPLDIPLRTGWNIISFPSAAMVDAKTVIQSLIDQNKLIKVQDEVGNSIENWGIFGGWKNGIGNFIPGKAYKVKMNADAVLTLQQNYPKSANILANSEKPVYFSTGVEGNGVDHMNINLIGLHDSEISIGDELAAFDGEICVGALKITADHISNGTVSLIVSSSTNDNSQDGFTVGNPIIIYAWNQISGDELKVLTEVVNGKLTYEKNSSVMVQLKSLTTNAKSIEDFVKIDVFPNPSQGKITVRFSQLPDSGSRIEILDISGRKIATRLIAGTSEEFNLDNQPAGIYIVKSILGSDEIIRKLIINK